MNKFILTVAIFAALVLSVCSVVLGPLNQDEGWYLLAALNTADGMLPYRDYFFTQGPVTPFVYALFSPLWAPFGVLGGRVFTLALSLVSLAIWCAVANRLEGDNSRKSMSAFVAFLLIALNPVYSYFIVIPKTYALSGLFIAAAFYALSSNARFRFETSGVALALAAGTRLSLGILLAVAGLWLIFNGEQTTNRHDCKSTKHESVRRSQFIVHNFSWLRFGVAGVLTLAVIYVPFLIVCHEQFVFSQTYHTARAGGGLASWAVLRGGFVSRLLQGYFFVLVALVAGVLFVGCKTHENTRKGKQNSVCFRVRSWFKEFITSPLALIAISFLVVFAVHFFAPFPYDDYQTPVMPLAAVFAAVLLGRAERPESPGGTAMNGSRELRMPELRPCLLVLALCFLASSPMLMNWMAIRQDRFWFEMKQKPDLIVLRETADKINVVRGGARTPVLLTQDAYLAVEAGMRVPRGLEMGPFSIFPDLSDKEARKFNVHNLNTLRELIESTDIRFAALSGYAFAISCPSTAQLTPEQSEPLFSTVSNRFEKVFTVPDFGQEHTTLTMWALK